MEGRKTVIIFLRGGVAVINPCAGNRLSISNFTLIIFYFIVEDIVELVWITDFSSFLCRFIFGCSFGFDPLVCW